MDVVKGLYEVAKQRKETKQEGSYTCYLFEQGLDKILKKCGEECSEVIIAAKNGNNEDTANEICDLLYHLIVMMVQAGLSSPMASIICISLTEISLNSGVISAFPSISMIS